MLFVSLEEIRTEELVDNTCVTVRCFGMNPILILNRLLKAAGPSGHEQACAEVISEIAHPFVDEILVDPLGSLICHKKGAGNRILAAAHMDVIGFMVSRIDEKGFLRVVPIGSHPAARLIGFPIRFLNGTAGILFSSDFEGVRKKRFDEVKIEDIYVDIGAWSREEAESLVQPGDVAVFDGLARKISGNKILSPYLDDLIGCVILLLAMAMRPASDNDVYYVFTVHEELRARGAGPVAERICPELALAVDICHTGDCPAYSEEITTKLGGGPAIKLYDLSAICDLRLVKHIKNVALAREIRFQNEISHTGGTDAGAIQMSSAGVPVSGLSVATRYSHTPVEMCALDDVVDAARLLAAVMAAEPVFLR